MLGLRLLALLIPDDSILFRPRGLGPKPGGLDKRSGM